MSLGWGYDMVLLTPRAPLPDDVTTDPQPRRRQRPGRGSRSTHQARRDRDHPDTTQARGNAPRSAGIPCPAVGTESPVGDLSILSLGKEKILATHGDASSSSSVPPPPEGPALAERRPAVAPSPYPFGLINAAAAFASAYASKHAEPSGLHQRFALDFSPATSAHAHADSSEEDEAWAGAGFSSLCDPEAMRRFMTASDYCFGYSDSDDEGTYDLSRECFHIGLGMPRAGEEDRQPFPAPGKGGRCHTSVSRSPDSTERESCPRGASTPRPGAAPRASSQGRTRPTPSATASGHSRAGAARAR